MIKNFGIDIEVNLAFFSDNYVEALLWKIIKTGTLECAKFANKTPIPVASEYYDAEKIHITRLYRIYHEKECEKSCMPVFLTAIHRVYVLEAHILPDLFNVTDQYLLTLINNLIENGVNELEITSNINREHANIKTMSISEPFIVSKQ